MYVSFARDWRRGVVARLSLTRGHQCRYSVQGTTVHNINTVGTGNNNTAVSGTLMYWGYTVFGLVQYYHRGVIVVGTMIYETPYLQLPPKLRAWGIVAD